MPVLNLLESIERIKPYGIKFAKHRVVESESALEGACAQLGWPVVMKVVSDRVSHKSDVGGVVLNIENLAEARAAFRHMRKIKGFRAALVQEFIKGKLVIIGGKRDVQFGPTVLFGLGGIFVEVFKDFSIGICPLKKQDARKIVRRIKAFELLKGVRGQKSVDIPAVEDAIVQVSKLMCREHDIKELDLNPLIANEKGVVAVDARAVV
jgi:acyl-CoA synthetase (NDP forming)